jgi:hypothetical protein
MEYKGKVKNYSLNSSRKFKSLISVLRDIDRKPIARMVYEIVHLLIKTKKIPMHYFASLLYKNNVKNYLEYLDLKEMRRIQEILCDVGVTEILNNKLFFQEYYSLHDFPLPHFIGYNLRESGFVKKNGTWDRYNLNDFNSMNRLLEIVLSASKSGALFIKPINDSCGNYIKRINSSSFRFIRQEISEIQRFLLMGSYIMQEEVIQHKELNRVNCSSVNTIRIDTFKERGETPEILSAYLRMGSSGSHIDNISAGGVFVGIDILTNTLKPHGFNRIASGGNTLYMHPDSKIVFRGFRLPFLDKAKQLAIAAASMLPRAMVGWDIAVSDKGPVLIEGNALYYGMKSSDVAYGGYRKNKIYQKAKAAAMSLEKNFK